MAVAVNLFPVTGQPLPLVSMGGTSTLFTSLALGIILSVSREVEREKKEGGDELAAA
jgi:cell division protein FtsW